MRHLYISVPTINQEQTQGHGNSQQIFARGLRNFNQEFKEGILVDSEIISSVKRTIKQNLPHKRKFTKVIKLPNGMQAILSGGQHIILGKLLREIAVQGSRERLVRETARAIVHAYKVPSKDFINEAGAIQNFIQRYMRYTFDNGEQFCYPHRALIDWYFDKDGLDCDCMAILFASLMLALGWRKVWIVLVDSRGDGVLSHACAAIKMPRPNTRFGMGNVNVELTKPVRLGWRPSAKRGEPEYSKYLKINVVKPIQGG